MKKTYILCVFIMFSCFNAQSQTTTWTGAADTNWDNPVNWTSGIPDHTIDVIIPNPGALFNLNYPIANGPIAECSTLIIEPGGELTDNTTEIGLVVYTSLVINSDATGYGSLILNSIGGGTPISESTYNLFIDDAEWHLLGSPFTGQTINSTFISNNSIIGMKDYIENPDGWETTDYAVTAPDVAFSLGKGYVTKISSAGVVSLTGTPNNEDVDITLASDGYCWNLLSNPFTSSIAANTDGHATNNLLSINADVFASGYQAFYIWDANSTSYKIYNLTTMDLDYMQVGQGFFVKSKIGGGTFSITTAMQSHQTAAAFKSEETVWAHISLLVKTDNLKASTELYFNRDMSRGLDNGFDAGMLKSGSLVLYSRLVEEDNRIDLGIQSLPTDYENLIIPIGLDAKAGEIITFSARALNIPEEYAVVLEDRALNVFTDLSDDGSYSIQLSENSNGTGRFFVYTSFKSATGIGDLDADNVFQVFTRPSDNQLFIRGEVFGNSVARIYSITGKQIAVLSLQEAMENRIPFNGDVGIYIVQISNESGSYTQKFAWVK